MQLGRLGEISGSVYMEDLGLGKCFRSKWTKEEEEQIEAFEVLR